MRAPKLTTFRTAGVALAAAAALGTVAIPLAGCGDDAQAASGGTHVIVLGIDGMDHELTTRLMAEGRMPSFERLAEQGAFQALGTSVPPQSPVAWSDFITGLDSGGHGIYDFVHRDPSNMLPYLSTSRTSEADKVWKLGKYQIPLSGGDVELLRHGTPFWELLDERGVETTIIRMPANFPPSGTATREISGMGTPDLLGTYGTFSFYTSELFAFSGEDVSGGDVYEIWPEDNVLTAEIEGPDNPFLVEPEKVTAEFTVYIDPDNDTVKLEVGDESRVFGVGEWTDWVPIEFDLVPTQSIGAMARFYLKSLEPEFQLYVTPINFDPFSPALPISHPESYAAELAEATGRYYTQGMPEDTNALDSGVFDRDDFLAQARLAGEELIEQYRSVLADFDGGLLFYYFGNIDQISHMLWRAMDPGHPSYDEGKDRPHADVIPSLYEEMDRVVGETMAAMGPDTLLVVMSDHGFTSWRREFNLNSWLYESGYLKARNPDLSRDAGMFTNVDWTGTKAYGLGINGLYLNLKGRERNGIVDPSERQALAKRIADELLQVVDPATGEKAITKVYLRDEVFRDEGHTEIGPDIIVGYAKGTRCSNDSTLGKLAPEVFADNSEEWSGDHLMDHEAVPGILLTSRPLRKPAPSLKELAGAILAEFGIDEFPRREG